MTIPTRNGGKIYVTLSTDGTGAREEGSHEVGLYEWMPREFSFHSHQLILNSTQFWIALGLGESGLQSGDLQPLKCISSRGYINPGPRNVIIFYSFH